MSLKSVLIFLVALLIIVGVYLLLPKHSTPLGVPVVAPSEEVVLQFPKDTPYLSAASAVNPQTLRVKGAEASAVQLSVEKTPFEIYQSYASYFTASGWTIQKDGFINSLLRTRLIATRGNTTMTMNAFMPPSYLADSVAQKLTDSNGKPIVKGVSGVTLMYSTKKN